MNETLNSLAPFEKAFQHNLEIRPCGFNPRELFATYEDTDRGLVFESLPADAKKEWFLSYCDLKKVNGRLEDDDFTVTVFESTGKGMVVAKARVIIDDVCVATGCASKGFSLDDVTGMNGVIQYATGSALSRALSNAGFGAVCTTEPDSTPPYIPGDNGNLPFTFGSAPTAPAPGTTPPAQPFIPPVSCRNPSSTAGAVNAPAVNQCNDSSQTSLFQQPAATQEDPLAAAKAEMWPCSGYYAGKTLGEILATKPDKIIWLAEKYTKESPAKEAAKLLLPEAKKRCGK